MKRLELALGDEEERQWEELRPGVAVSWIRRAEDAAELSKRDSYFASAFLRYEPGARVPSHKHLGYEIIEMLEGEQQDEEGSYGPGALIVNFPGSVHSLYSPGGCLLKIFWTGPIQFLE